MNHHDTMHDTKDKPFSSHIENKDNSVHDGEHDYAPETAGLAKEYDPAFVKKTIRKLDIRLLIILGAMYSIALIDRTNLSSARVAGMSKELRL